MATTSRKGKTPSPLVVRLDKQSKDYLRKAAKLRGVSVSDYIRLVAVSQARREVLEHEPETIVLSPEGQLAFWTAIHATTPLTEAQRELGKLIRGES